MADTSAPGGSGRRARSTPLSRRSPGLRGADLLEAALEGLAAGRPGPPVDPETVAPGLRGLALATNAALLAVGARSGDRQRLRDAGQALHQALVALERLTGEIRRSESSSSSEASVIQATTQAVGELKGASQQIAASTQMVATIAEQTLSAARSGEGAIRALFEGMDRARGYAREVHDAMTRLSRRIERIGSVVDVIDEIADRSDLLALNAALEGAKAGEAGRGFSVVATEMRRLAENVLESTREIKSLIDEIREASQGAQNAANLNAGVAAEGERLGEAAMVSLTGILDGIEETSDAARVIHLATQQQRTATEHVVARMSQLEEVMKDTQAGDGQGLSSELDDVAERIADLARGFQAE